MEYLSTLTVLDTILYPNYTTFKLNIQGESNPYITYSFLIILSLLFFLIDFQALKNITEGK